MDPVRVDDFHAFLGAALQKLGSELWQEYLRVSAGQAAERRRLADEVERLQVELRTAGGGTADEPQHGLTVMQPPPSARVALLMTEDACAKVAPPTILPALLPYNASVDILSESNHLSQSSTADSPSSTTSPEVTERDRFQLKKAATGPLVLRTCTGRPLPRLVFSQEHLGATVSSKASVSHCPEHQATRSEGGLAAIEGGSSCSSGDGQRVVSTFLSRGGVQTEWSNQVLKRRLQARLSSLRSKGLIKGRDLYQTMFTMRLRKYSVEEMDRLITHVSIAINLRFREMIQPVTVVSSHSSVGSDVESRAEWHWPDIDGSVSARSGATVRERAFSVLSSNSASSADSDKFSEQVIAAIPFRALVELFCKDEKYLERCLGPVLTDQVYAMREVLLTGEANRIISEMTFVTIDDLASHRRRRNPTSVMDALAGLAILLHGIAVGLHTDPRFRSFMYWSWVEVAFTTFFACELLVRVRLLSCRGYFFGPDRWWHIFDAALVVFGALDCATDFTNAFSLPSPGAFRLIRFARLYRAVRRFKFMLELRLMVKAVLSGTRTLFWAFVLLVFVLYTFGVVSAILFSDAPDAAVRELFANVPTAMFTTFRCVTGDCFTTTGASLTATLYAQYGVLFAVVFIGMYMVITLGLFNVILAIYVDVTMVAVKQTDDANKGKHEQESIRVAQLTKRLLKMFCAAHRAYGKLQYLERHSIGLHDIITTADTTDVEIDDDIVISREMYMLITQDTEVRRTMDELDIPPDRAALFDCFDADGSGGLQATELVRGFLKVRGEVKKADHVACILALRSIQTMVKHMKDTIEDHGRVLNLMREGADIAPLNKVADRQP